MKWVWLIILLLTLSAVYGQELIKEHPTLEELVVLPEKKISWGGMSCEECHLDAQKMTSFDKYQFYINKEEYTTTIHGNSSQCNSTCIDCHLLEMPVYTAKGKEFLDWGGSCPPPRIIGGFGSNATYHTVPSEGCVNKSKGCHWTREVFFKSEHFLIDDMSRIEEYWNSSSEGYKPWYCEGCHASCGSCHWGGPEPKEEEKFKFNFLENVGKHEIIRKTTNKTCAICHNGRYNFTEVAPEVSIYSHPQYEEWKISVHNDIDCRDCHRNIHGATYEVGEYGKARGPTTCGTCHTEVIKSLEAGPHIDVACYSCHSTWLPIWQDPESLTLEPKTLLHGNPEDAQTWMTHEIRKKEDTRKCDYCHGNTTTQREYVEQKEEAIQKMNKSVNDVIRAKAVEVTAVLLAYADAKASWAHVSPDRDELTEEALSRAKEAKRNADLINFISFLAYLATVLAIIGLVLVIWPYD